VRDEELGCVREGSKKDRVTPKGRGRIFTVKENILFGGVAAPGAMNRKQGTEELYQGSNTTSEPPWVGAENGEGVKGGVMSAEKENTRAITGCIRGSQVETKGANKKPPYTKTIPNKGKR